MRFDGIDYTEKKAIKSIGGIELDIVFIYLFNPCI